MIGQYVNTGGRRVTISPAVLGAQYRITAWALGDGRRSAAPAEYPATKKSKCDVLPHLLGKFLHGYRLRHYKNYANSTSQIRTSWTMPLSDNKDVLTCII